jgi:mono/diheme cytochrome c family protein
MAATSIWVAVALATAAGNVQFDQYCSSCHGMDAQGIGNLGVSLIDSAFVARTSEQDLVEFLKVGRLPDDPATVSGRPIPEFSWVAEGELQAIASFLKSLGEKN